MPADINSNYYIATSYGGWSPCIQGNNQYGLRPFAGSVLPNCVGYTVGRFNELLNEGACTWLENTNANNMLNLAISQGLSYGDDPVVGGVICWDSSDTGHCAVIEQVINANEVVCSESGWSYTTTPIVRTYTHYRVGGQWQHIIPGYTYQGIFYPPGYTPGSTDAENYYIMFLQGELMKWM